MTNKNKQQQNNDVRTILKVLHLPKYINVYLLKQMKNERVQRTLIQKLQKENQQLNRMNYALMNRLDYEKIRPLSIANVMPYLQSMKKKQKLYITIKGLRDYFHIPMIQAWKTVDHLIELGIADSHEHVDNQIKKH